VYREQVIPVVKVQKGNLDCRLLEPMEKGAEYISMTTWETREDADAYHDSGVYRDLVEKIRNDVARNSVLKVYTTESILIPA
jgi:heme-degrading monooxygenase HmoA